MDFDASRPLVFMHIPKTAGQALTKALQQALAPKRVIGGFDRVLFGGFQSFDGFAPEARSHVYLEPSEVPADGDFVAPHMAFSTLRERYPSGNYLTVLREPLSRILSLWLYWRAMPDEYLTQFGGWAQYVCQARKPLVEFLLCAAIACQTDNLVVRMLLWPHPLIPEGNFIAQDHDQVLLDQAFARLYEFGFVDVIENPQLCANLQAWLRRTLTIERINETTAIPALLRSPLERELSYEAINLIAMRTRLDAQLWTALASANMPGLDLEILRQGAILRSLARHACLMH